MMGKIVDKLGPVSYLIQCEDGSMWRRHVDHIQDISVSPEPTIAEIPINSNSPVLDDTSSDAFLYDSATETPRTVQCDAASSDSITDRMLPSRMSRLHQYLQHLVVLIELPSHLIVTCNILERRKCSVWTECIHSN